MPCSGEGGGRSCGHVFSLLEYPKTEPDVTTANGGCNLSDDSNCGVSGLPNGSDGREGPLPPIPELVNMSGPSSNCGLMTSM